MAATVITCLPYTSLLKSVPSFGVVTFLAILPATLFFLKERKLALSLMIVLTVAVVMSVITGARGGLEYLVQYGLLNAFMIFALRSETDILKVVFRSSLLTYLTIMIAIGSMAVLYGFDIHAFVSKYIDTVFDEVIKMSAQLGLSTEQASQYKETYLMMAESIKKMYPALVFLLYEFFALINLLIMNIFLRDDKKVYTKGMARWAPDEKLVWGLIFFGFLYFVKNNFAHLVALNALIVLLSAYLLCGVSIVSFYMKKKNAPLFVRAAVYYLLIMVYELRYLAIALGVFDIWFDFRKKKKNVT